MKNVLGKKFSTPTSVERKMISIIKKFNLPYKYTGNGTFWIGRCNPDFVNINGEKIAIEVFDKHMKEYYNSSVNNYISTRVKQLQKYGWRCIFIENKDLNEDTALRKLNKGVE